MTIDKSLKFLKKKWFWVLSILFIVLEAIFLLLINEGIYCSTHDNLELHVLDYHLLKELGMFFTHGDELPILNGISRDYFFSEFSAYSMLYFLFPTSIAYILGYLLKTIIGLGAFVLLFRDILKEKYQRYEPLVVLMGMAFGLLPLYSTFAFSFVSLPYLIYLLRKICETGRRKYYVLLFLYPLVSYFTFVGIFILGYLVFVVIYTFFKKREYFVKLLISFFVLMIGYIACEYRLFNTMLFDPVATIRDTMVIASLSGGEIISTIWNEFAEGSFHADAVHDYFVFPITMIYFLYLLFTYGKKKEWNLFFKDTYVQIMGLLFLNSVIYGIYYWEPFRTLVETILPPVKGLQFNRTNFFNPFLWYVLFFILLQRIYDMEKKKLSYVLSVIAIFVVLCSNSKYNDLYWTARNYAYRLITGEESNNLTFAEFYSEDLMQIIKEDIAYDGEKAISYGLDPGIIAYSGIETLDGCLSYYPLSYKEEFRKVIAPALEENESSRVYFDDWGARAYIYPANGESIYEALKEQEITVDTLTIDMDAFQALDGIYIFSRIELANADELGIILRGVYEEESSPYTIYLYQIESE
ncbi:MAG: DUF6044 family protein [Eubacteriales bacterium]